MFPLKGEIQHEFLLRWTGKKQMNEGMTANLAESLFKCPFRCLHFQLLSLKQFTCYNQWLTESTWLQTWKEKKNPIYVQELPRCEAPLCMIAHGWRKSCNNIQWSVCTPGAEISCPPSIRQLHVQAMALHFCKVPSALILSTLNSSTTRTKITPTRPRRERPT